MIQKTRQITYAQAICEATHQAFELDPSVFLMGQGIQGAGFIFGTVEGLFEKFGSDRVIEMPLSEAATAGICIGAALDGMRPILVIQRADFLYLMLDQLINHAAKWRFMFGGQTKIPLVVRCIIGKGWGQGPQHSQSLHSLCSHFPGLRVVFPSLPSDAYGLLLNSVFSDDPVIFFEGRLQHSQKGEVPIEPFVRPFGKIRIISEGRDITVLNCSFTLQEARTAVEQLSQEYISVELLDLISISPLDYAGIEASVRKTKRLLIVDTSWKTSGISSTISAEISRRLFNHLKAPIEILTVPDCPVPTAANLEAAYYPSVKDILDFTRHLVKI